MTTFTALTDTTLSQDKPFTQSVARAMRDNPKALAEGDITAPEVVGTSPLLRVDASNTAALVLNNLPDGYDILDFDLVNIKPVTITNQFIMEWSVDNGTTWLSASDSYVTALQSQTSGTTGASAAYNSRVLMTDSIDIGNGSASAGINGVVRTTGMSKVSIQKIANFEIFLRLNNNDVYMMRGFSSSGNVASTAKITAVRFRFVTGNIASGYIAMRRVRPA